LLAKKREIPKRHVIGALLKTGGIKVRAELLGEKVADVVALRPMTVTHAKQGRVFYPGPDDVRVLVFFLSVLWLVSSLVGIGKAKSVRQDPMQCARISDSSKSEEHAVR
jgi:hypothetical protein